MQIYFYKFNKAFLIYFYSRVSYRRVFISDFIILNNFDKILVGLGRVIRKVKTSKRIVPFTMLSWSMLKKVIRSDTSRLCLRFQDLVRPSVQLAIIYDKPSNPIKRSVIWKATRPSYRIPWENTFYNSLICSNQSVT